MQAYIILFLIVAALVLNANALLAQSSPSTLTSFDPLSPYNSSYWNSGLYYTPSHILGQGRIPYRAKNGKWGYCNAEKQIIIGAEYEEVECFPSVGCAIVKKKGKWGLIDSSGKVVRPCEYTWMARSDNGIRVNAGGYVNKSNYPEGGKWGFLSISGKEILPLRYTDVYENYTKEIYAVSSKGLRAYNLNGEEVITPEYEKVQVLSDTYTPVEIDGQWGLIDHSGKEVVRPQYNQIESTNYQNLFVVKIEQKWGFLHGKELLLRRYDYIGHLDIYDGYIDVSEDDKEGLVDSTGKEVVPLRYESIFRYSGGYMCIKLNGKYGFIDRTGREVIPPRYDYAFIFSEGYASVQNNGKYGFVDTTGKEVVPLRYDKVRDFTSGYALVMLNSKCSFIDHSGREVIPPRYDDIEDFSEGFAAVMLDNKCGFIDSTGREVVPPRYDNVGCFTQGYAVVQMGNKYGFIDRTGKEVIPPRYERISSIVNGYIKVTKEQTLGDKTEYLLQGYVGIDGSEYWEGGYTAPKSTKSLLQKKGGE